MRPLKGVKFVYLKIAEAYLRSDDYRLLRILGQQPAVRTIMFMTMSMLIMDSQAVLKSDLFW